MQQTLTKSEVFARELGFIKDERIRESARIMLDLLPDYFYKIEASSTGKYHPPFSLGEGGLTRHVKVAVKFAYDLFTIYKFDDETKDLIIFALLIHDGVKKGIVETRYTKFDHPLLIGKYLMECKDKLSLNEEEISRIVKMTASHMGKWNTNPYEPNVILPLPKTVEEKFVHMCDFLSSRKFVHVDFDEKVEIME